MMRRKKQRIIEDKRASILLFVALVPIICSAGVLDPWQWARSDRIEVNIPWLPFENETRCYDELGCLNITRNWYHLIHRPLNVFPLPREVINTRFILYTNENLIEGQVLTVAKDKLIKRSNFNSKRKTKFIIHGFIDTPLSNWVKEMRNELLKHDDYNVIIVDWAGGSLPLYTQATANTRLVGLEIAHLIKHLQTNYGLDPNDVHLIGHSLGAHTAGYAGEKMGGSIGRITGLDPAEPYFQGMPNHLRLDYTDAKLVDVIHTDGKSIFFLGKHYRITINLAQPSSAESWVQGFMKVTFHAENGIIRDVDLTPSGYMKLEHGSTVRMVIAHPAGTSTSLGKIRRVELSWTYDMDVLQPRSLCFFWCNDRLYVNSVTVDVMELPGRGKREADITSKLCSANKKEYAEIASGSIASFIDNC